MFTVRLGPRPAVVLCGYSALRDTLVLQADAFSGRGAMPVFERFTRGNGKSQAAEALAWTTQFERSGAGPGRWGGAEREGQ